MKVDVVSLFSGGGGLDLGFIKAGYNIVWAIDNAINAVSTYKANIGEHIICADINKIDLNSIPKADIVIGGPPCQSFSLAGNRNTEDQRGRLVWRYLDIIKHVSPIAFVFENVTGLLSAKNKKGESIFNQLKLAFDGIGYTINAQVMNAADYGVPQKRKRVIVVGLKNGNTFCFPHPSHSATGEFNKKKYVSAQEALDDLPPASDSVIHESTYLHAPQNDYQRLMQWNGVITDHKIPRMSQMDKYIISFVKPGGNYMDIPSDVPSARIQRLQREGGHTTCYGRLRPDEPAYTINTYFNRPNVGCNIHYEADRLITVREALRLQSFPDSYQLVSTSVQGKGLIVGNAVPPLLAEVIARQLMKFL